MKYHFKIHREKSGFWAECLELAGCRTQANSQVELFHNMSEALNLFLSEPADSKLFFPLPKKNPRSADTVAVNVRPGVAFAVILRRLRLRHGFTQKDVALKMGFKNLYSYQRLENGKTANPELATLVEIKKVFPEFSLDEILAA